MREAFICDTARTPIGRYGGALAKVRTDDLAAAPIKALISRNAKADWSRLDEVFFGCANQAGEQQSHAGHVAVVLARLIGAAIDDLVELAPIGLRKARHQRLDRRGGEVVGTQLGEGPSEAADRCAHAFANEHFAGHVGSPRWRI